MTRRVKLVLAAVMLLAGCATLQQVAALRQVAFSLGGLSSASLAGVPLERIASYRDLSVADAARLGVAVARNDFPFEFMVDVKAVNPAANSTNARMVRMGWTLFLDQKETVRGTVDSSYVLPPGDTVMIPLRMKLDLREFFDGGVEEIFNLATGLAGARADPTRIALELLPRVDTPVGPISYPMPIRATIGGR